ncbi:hypothetical protein DFJ74DRAFT_701205 [Hyaloraphidium curvatum]|nr:hypothetical protein DFJ74DRAFT_701205 [Hyaloraphidium curvatum]
METPGCAACAAAGGACGGPDCLVSAAPWAAAGAAGVAAGLRLLDLARIAPLLPDSVPLFDRDAQSAALDALRAGRAAGAAGAAWRGPGDAEAASPGRGAPRRRGVPLPPASAPPSALFHACVAGFWRCAPPMLPLVHKSAWLRAFGPAPPPPFAGPPWALSFAMAAAGSLWDPAIEGATQAERVRAGRHYAARARDQLVAGWVARRPGARTISDLEAAMTMLLLASYYHPVGQLQRVLPLIEALVALTSLLCLGPERDGWASLAARPANADEWAVEQMKIRLYCAVAILDTVMSFYLGKQTYVPWLRYPMPIACPEFLFDFDPPEAAFAAVSGANGLPGLPERIVDLRPVLEPGTVPMMRRALVQSLVEDGLAGRTSLVAIHLLTLVLRTLMLRIRDLAAAEKAGLSPPDPSPPNPSPAASTPAGSTQGSGTSGPLQRSTPPTLASVRRRAPAPPYTVAQVAAHVASIVDDITSSFPADFGPALLVGQLGPFWTRAPEVFTSEGLHYNFLMGVVMVLQYTLELAAAAPADPSVPFSSQPHLRRALGAALAIASVFSSVLARDPSLQHMHTTTFAAAMRAAMFLLSARSGAPAALRPACDAGARAVAGFFAAISGRYAHVAGNLARQLGQAMDAAGVGREAPRGGGGLLVPTAAAEAVREAEEQVVRLGYDLEEAAEVGGDSDGE